MGHHEAAPQAAGSGNDAAGPLAEARFHWGDAYDIGPVPDGDGYQAVRRDGKGALTRSGLEALWSAMTADYVAHPVRAGDDAVQAAADGEEQLTAWLDADPAARAWQDRDGTWSGTYPVNEVRFLSTGRHATPRELAAVLEVLVTACAEVLLIEAEHPGWLARRWPDGTWRAVKSRGYEKAPLAASAADAEGLRAAIRAAAAAVPS